MGLVKRLRPSVQEIQDFVMEKGETLLIRDGHLEHVFFVVFGNEEGRVGPPAIITHHQFGTDHPREAMPIIGAAIKQWNQDADRGKKDKEIIGLVTLGEIWISKYDSKEDMDKEGVPPSESENRQEAVMSYASDRDGYSRMTLAPIKRTRKGKPLGLEEMVVYEQQMMTVFNPWGGPHQA